MYLKVFVYRNTRRYNFNDDNSPDEIFDVAERKKEGRKRKKKKKKKEKTIEIINVDLFYPIHELKEEEKKITIKLA